MKACLYSSGPSAASAAKSQQSAKIRCILQLRRDLLTQGTKEILDKTELIVSPPWWELPVGQPGEFNECVYSPTLSVEPPVAYLLC